MTQIHTMCYFRNHIAVAELAKKHEATKKGKRALDIFPKFYEGLSALYQARKTKDVKWKAIGENVLNSISNVAQHGTWNFENKQMLLQAELYHLKCRNRMADIAYRAAIASAQEHKFIQEEALAFELYGIYLVENERRGKGLKQLEIAAKKYKQWGALKKAQHVNDFIMDIFSSTSV